MRDRCKLSHLDAHTQARTGTDGGGEGPDAERGGGANVEGRKQGKINGNQRRRHEFQLSLRGVSP